MKKLVYVLFAVLFLVSLALAQHTNVVKVNGNRNDADINQQFDGSGTFYQGNEAFVDQIGDDNDVDVDQFNNGYAGAKHWTKIKQQGNANDVDVWQNNDGGTSEVTQIGHRNDGDTYQNGNKMDAVIKQLGNDNDGDITEWGTHLTGFISQNGNRNDADQKMGDGMGQKAEGSSFSATQIGDDNDANQYMEGDGWAGGINVLNNNGTIRQQGNGNEAKQDMRLWSAGNNLNMNNIADINQLGNNNDARQYQKGDGNSSSIFQTGNDNDARSQQN